MPNPCPPHEEQDFSDIDTAYPLYIPGFSPDNNIEKVQEGLNNIPSSASWDPVFGTNLSSFHDYDEALFRNIEMDVNTPKISFDNNYNNSDDTHYDNLDNLTITLKYKIVEPNTCIQAYTMYYNTPDEAPNINLNEFSDKNIINISAKITNINLDFLASINLLSARAYYDIDNLSNILFKPILNNNNNTSDFLDNYYGENNLNPPINLFQIDFELTYFEDFEIKKSNTLTCYYELEWE